VKNCAAEFVEAVLTINVRIRGITVNVAVLVRHRFFAEALVIRYVPKGSQEDQRTVKSALVIPLAWEKRASRMRIALVLARMSDHGSAARLAIVVPKIKCRSLQDVSVDVKVLCRFFAVNSAIQLVLRGKRGSSRTVMSVLVLKQPVLIHVCFWTRTPANALVLEMRKPVTVYAFLVLPIRCLFLPMDVPVGAQMRYRFCAMETAMNLVLTLIKPENPVVVECVPVLNLAVIP